MPGAPNYGATGAFLCYSTYQVNPGVWPFSGVGPAHHDAAQLMALGYWSPYAEQSVPTQTQLGNGWYLDCKLPATLKPAASGDLMGLGGTMFSPTKLAGEPGYYPIAKKVAAAA
jgi:hypothetical protein